MSLIGRLSVGITVAVLPLVVVIALLVGRLDELRRAGDEVVHVQVRAAGHATEIRWRSDALGASFGKYLVSGDLGYWEDAQAQAHHIDEHVAALDALGLGGAEGEAHDALARSWRAVAEGPGDGLSAASRDRDGDDAFEEALDALRARSDALDVAAREAMASHARSSAERSRQAARWATWVAVAALVASIALFLLTFHSLSRPLEALLAGTRRVAAGDLAGRVEVSSRDELGQLALAFNAMVADLAELESAKTTFVSHVSHELRTPLVGIVETNAVLLDEIVAPLHPRQRRMLELNQAAAARLSAMIGELLELSTLSARLRYTFARRDVGEVAARVVASVEARFAHAGVALVLHRPAEPVVALIDADRVAQVVLNLVDNAIKVTPRGGRVEVSVGAGRGSDLPEDAVGSPDRSAARAYASIVVEDTGPGLDDDDTHRLFERFARGRHGPRGSSAGFGLGLAICREIVLAHEGAVVAGRRAGGQGARFLVALPLARDAARGRARPAPSALPVAALALAALGGCASAPPVMDGAAGAWARGDVAAALAAHDDAAARAEDPERRAAALVEGALAILTVDPADGQGLARARLARAARAATGSPRGRQAQVLLTLVAGHAASERVQADRRRAVDAVQAELERTQRRSELLERELETAQVEAADHAEERKRLAAELRESRASAEVLTADVERLRRELDELKRIDLRRRR